VSKFSECTYLATSSLSSGPDRSFEPLTRVSHSMSSEEQQLARIRASIAQAFAPLAAEIRALTEELRELNAGGGGLHRGQVAGAPALLTAGQVAKKLSVSTGTVYNLIRMRKLRVVQIGRVPRISEADLAAFLESRDGPADTAR
jgi:excisionase family DNA binding protein